MAKFEGILSIENNEPEKAVVKFNEALQKF
jgi:hypothetical protein